MLKSILWVGELVQIFPFDGKEDKIYNAIRKGLPKHARIYRKDELPERYNCKKHNRIAPLLVLSDEGWVLTTRKRLAEGESKFDPDSSGGSHGYDNELESMRALFVVHGPAFKNGFVSEPFGNIEVYNLMCGILNLKPVANNGNFENIKHLLSGTASRP